MSITLLTETWLAGEQPLVPLWERDDVDVYGETHVGRVRESNQDSFGIRSDLGLFVVADGVGGHAGGELASQMAVRIVEEEVMARVQDLSARAPAVRQQVFSQSVNVASLKIFERSLELPQYRGMATTFTSLWIPTKSIRDTIDSGIIAHVGDSRCYLLRTGFLYQLTDDHSFINEQIKLGRLKPTDPIVSQIKNVITRCVGNQEEEEIDTRSVKLFSGDRFLLCSDGLSSKVSEEEIAEVLSNFSPREGCEKLIRLANERGGEDNITVVIVILK